MENITLNGQPIPAEYGVAEGLGAWDREADQDYEDWSA